MKATSLKQKVNRALLKDKKFTKSESSKSRVIGLKNITSGFTFDKMWDDYYLYWTTGNMIYRGMPIEEINQKTEAVYLYLVEQGLGEFLEIVDDFKRQKAIKLKHLT